VEVASRSLVAATENRRVSSDRYKAGTGLSSELLDAEAGALRAGLDRTAMLARLRVALASLDRAAGR
jgi:outer membrane protein TolC